MLNLKKVFGIYVEEIPADTSHVWRSLSRQISFTFYSRAQEIYIYSEFGRNIDMNQIKKNCRINELKIWNWLDSLGLKLSTWR